MKTIYHNRQRMTIHTQKDLAAAFGLLPSHLWYRIYISKTVPPPNFRFGQRDYYTADAFRHLVADHAVEQQEASVSS